MAIRQCRANGRMAEDQPRHVHPLSNRPIRRASLSDTHRGRVSDASDGSLREPRSRISLGPCSGGRAVTPGTPSPASQRWQWLRHRDVAQEGSRDEPVGPARRGSSPRRTSAPSRRRCRTRPARSRRRCGRPDRPRQSSWALTGTRSTLLPAHRGFGESARSRSPHPDRRRRLRAVHGTCDSFEGHAAMHLTPTEALRKRDEFMDDGYNRHSECRRRADAGGIAGVDGGVLCQPPG